MTAAISPDAVLDRTALLEVDKLVVEYAGRGLRRTKFRALKRVCLRIAAGETLGLVDESGSGKATLGRAVLGLAPVTEGRILFENNDISHLDKRARRRLLAATAGA